MATTRSAETLALDKSQQKEVTKRTRQIKKGLEDGSIQISNTHKENKLKAEQKRGLIYIGHIPHGFYEEAMRDYFKQFGRVTNVKLCRSRTTGNSKGYGYVEFAHPEVAKIAADTMNNYVMFKKRIVTEFVPYEKRPKGLFHGKSSTTQHTSVKSRSGKQKFSRNAVLDSKVVSKKRKNTLKKLNSKIKKLQDLGIQCNIQPVGLEEDDSREIKMEQPINISSTSAIHNSDPEVEFKKPSSKLIKSKNVLSSQSKGSSNKSLNTIKSKRTFLTKSLDSVKTLLSKNSIDSSQDEETQTFPLEGPKKGRKNSENKKLKGIVKVKKERKPLILNQETVKKIARELVRKRGNPLINVVSTKPKKLTKRK